MNNQQPDSFERFIDLMLSGSRGTEEAAIGIIRAHPIAILDMVKAAERAGGLTREVILEFAPAPFRKGGVGATLESFLAFWQTIQFCNNRYKWNGASVAPKRIVVPKKDDNPGAGPEEKGPRRGIATRMAAALGIPNDPAAILAKLEEFRGGDRNWEGARIKLSREHQFEIGLPSLNAFASLMKRQVGHPAEKE